MLASFAALLLATAPAPAARASEQVQWSAPAECPSETDVKARVDRILAEGGSGRREDVRLRLHVERVGDGYRLSAELVADTASSGRRVVEGARCDDLADAAVLIAAIAIDPDLVPPEPTSPAEEPSAADAEAVPEPPEPEPEPVPVPEPGEPTHPEAEEPGAGATDELARQSVLDPIASGPSKRSRARTSVTPIATVDLGLGLGRLAAPVPMAMGRAGAGIEIGAFRGLVRVSAFGPSRGQLDGSPATGLFGAVTGGLAGCGRTPGSRLAFVGCLGTDLGAAFGRGENTTNTRSARSLWWGIEAEAGLELALGPRIALALRGDGGVMPVRTDFVVDGQGRPCCVRWGAGLRLGVLGRFGRTPQR